MPVKEYSRVKHHEDERPLLKVPQKSILEAEFFSDPEQQREMYLQMFLDKENHPLNSNEDTFRREGDNQSNHHQSIREDLSINERDNFSSSRLEDGDFQLTASQKTMSKKHITLGKTNKSVSFKESYDNQPTKIITKKDVNEIAQEVIKEKILALNDNIKFIKERNEDVQKEIDEAYACENPKLLEVVLEMILFHWDDIMDLFIDDLVEEEALELNRIEEVKQDQQRKRNSKLADQSLFGKFHDYKSVDLRDILGIFKEYKEAEQSIKTRIEYLAN